MVDIYLEGDLEWFHAHVEEGPSDVLDKDDDEEIDELAGCVSSLYLLFLVPIE